MASAVQAVAPAPGAVAVSSSVRCAGLYRARERRTPSSGPSHGESVPVRRVGLLRIVTERTFALRRNAAIRRKLSHPPGNVLLGSSPAARRPPPTGSTSEVAVSCVIPFPAAAPASDEPPLWFAHDDVDRLFDDGTILRPC